MDEQLRDLAIDFTRLPAIYAKSLSLEKIDNIYNKSLSEKLNQVPLNIGEIGCAASHLSIYQKIVADSIPYTLVLEDDVQLHTNIKDVVEDQILLHQKINHFDYLHFDYLAYGFDFLKIWFPGVYSILKLKRGYSKIYFLLLLCLKFTILLPILGYEELTKKIFSHSAIKPIRDMYFAGAYLVTLNGARKLLSLDPKVLYTADRLPNIVKKKLKLYVRIYTPLIATQLKKTFPSNLRM